MKNILIITSFCILISYCIHLRKKIRKQHETFTNILMHDLRVAILAQNRGLDLLRNDFNSEILNDICHTGKNILDMINTICDNYKFAYGNLTLNKETFCLNNLLIEVFNSLSQEAITKNIDIDYNFPEKFTLYADKQYLYKTFYMIFELAIFYSCANTTIKYILTKKNNLIEFQIKYSGSKLLKKIGTGIFADEHRFSSVGERVKIDFCKKILFAHGAKLKNIQNNGIENCFTFVLPISENITHFKQLKSKAQSRFIVEKEKSVL